MSLARSLGLAITRSVDQAKHSLATALRFEVSAPTSAADAHIPVYSITSAEEVQTIATGCDTDIGGLSSAKVDLDPQEGKGRFWGTLSSEIPRTAKMARSGYAGFRNKNRPTLFGTQTWDATMHPYLCLRVRNRLGKKAVESGEESKAAAAAAASSRDSFLRSALSSSSLSNNAIPSKQKAINALGLDLPSKAGPKFFVNVQTDGPVTSDLFQHRLPIDEDKGDAWQDVIIPLSDFVLLNTGQISPSQITMMREKIRTVGISVMLEHPAAVSYANEKRAQENSSSAEKNVDDKFTDNFALEEKEEEAETVPAATKRRGSSYNFDLGVERITCMSEEGVSGKESEDLSSML